MADRVVERADPAAGGPGTSAVTTAQWPGPAQRGATPLGLPYPEPTDPLADAAVHLKALTDKASQLLAVPGRVWGTASATTNANGDFNVAFGTLTTLWYYHLQCGTHGTANPVAAGLFVLRGVPPDPGAVWADSYGMDGLPLTGGVVFDYCFTGSK